MTDHGQHDQGETPGGDYDVWGADFGKVGIDGVTNNRIRLGPRTTRPGDDGRRAAQIRAALTAMRAHEVEWCCHPASLAEQLVDAVNAAAPAVAEQLTTGWAAAVDAVNAAGGQPWWRAGEIIVDEERDSDGNCPPEPQDGLGEARVQRSSGEAETSGSGAP